VTVDSEKPPNKIKEGIRKGGGGHLEIGMTQVSDEVAEKRGGRVNLLS